MASETSICNLALISIGEERINSIDDTNRRAVICKEFYAATRDAMIRAFPWDFAKARAELAAETTAPEFGYSYQYPLPSDCLKVLSVNGETIGWEVEGGKLLTDESAIKIKFLQQITDPNAFDASFVNGLAKRLARDIAYGITKNKGVKERAEKDYEEAESEGFLTGSQESSLDDANESDALIWIR